jgi:hypothetical protein
MYKYSEYKYSEWSTSTLLSYLPAESNSNSYVSTFPLAYIIKKGKLASSSDYIVRNCKSEERRNRSMHALECKLIISLTNLTVKLKLH